LDEIHEEALSERAWTIDTAIISQSYAILPNELLRVEVFQHLEPIDLFMMDLVMMYLLRSPPFCDHDGIAVSGTSASFKDGKCGNRAISSTWALVEI